MRAVFGSRELRSRKIPRLHADTNSIQYYGQLNNNKFVCSTLEWISKLIQVECQRGVSHFVEDILLRIGICSGAT